MPKVEHRHIIMMMVLRKNSKRFQIMPPHDHLDTHCNPTTSLKVWSLCPMILIKSEIQVDVWFLEELTLQLQISLRHLCVSVNSVLHPATFGQLLHTPNKRMSAKRVFTSIRTYHQLATPIVFSTRPTSYHARSKLGRVL